MFRWSTLSQRVPFAVLISLAACTSTEVYAASYPQCGACDGCPYKADGVCTPNRADFGYYHTRWRRWPSEEAREPPVTLEQEPKADLPRSIVPDKFDESEIAPPPRTRPRKRPDDDDDAPAELPLDSEKDQRIDPFRDDPLQGDLDKDTGRMEDATHRSSQASFKRTHDHHPDARGPYPETGKPFGQRQPSPLHYPAAGPVRPASAIGPGGDARHVNPLRPYSATPSANAVASRTLTTQASASQPIPQSSDKALHNPLRAH